MAAWDASKWQFPTGYTINDFIADTGTVLTISAGGIEIT
jgi:hypothetical protein